jgi:hypothetical protein
MRARVTSKPEQVVIAAIRALDLESVKSRLMDAEVGKGWSREHADDVETAYKNYLTMLVKYQDDAEDILLSKDVDEFWHTHILQTAKYADDCQNVFGTFVHHSPHLGPRSEAVQQKRSDLAEKTRALYEREFGDAEQAARAWYGVRATPPLEPAQAALSSYEIRSGRAALSSYEIGSARAALSSYEIRAGQAALSSYEVRAERAALSSYEIGADRAALSSYEIRAGQAALSSYEIRADKAALSSYEIRAERAALSSYETHPSTADSPAHRT